jgi:type II secretory pathway component PulF
MPVAVDLPQQWYESPRRQPFTVTDFARFCRQIGILIDQQIYLNRGVRIRTGRFKNLLSTTAVFTLQKINPP